MSDRVLFVGFDPFAMDLSDAPPGTAERIQEGIDASMADLAAAGHDAQFLALAEGDDGAEGKLRERLATSAFDCVVIGAGVRLLPKHTALFEALVDATIVAAPGARLAFNTTPADAAEAVRRQLGA